MEAVGGSVEVQDSSVIAGIVARDSVYKQLVGAVEVLIIRNPEEIGAVDVIEISGGEIGGGVCGHSVYEPVGPRLSRGIVIANPEVAHAAQVGIADHRKGIVEIEFRVVPSGVDLARISILPIIAGLAYSDFE